MGESMELGTIVKALSGFYYVRTERAILTCRARGKLRYEKVKPLVGDRVEVLPQPGETGVLQRVLPRKNEFARPAVANIDQMLILASGAIPVTDPFLIDQMTAMAEHSHCEPIICINKWDLAQPEALYEIYVRSGFQTLKLSATDGKGLKELEELLAGKTSALTGNSGVGKSSILNALNANLKIQVGEVSSKLGRGRHTTRHVELYELRNGGLVADTPGFSSFDVEKMETLPKEELPLVFRDFLPHIELCQFTHCSHTQEKGCAVLAALEEGKIQPSRHESYVRLFKQANEHKPWDQAK